MCQCVSVSSTLCLLSPVKCSSLRSWHAQDGTRWARSSGLYSLRMMSMATGGSPVQLGSVVRFDPLFMLAAVDGLTSVPLLAERRWYPSRPVVPCSCPLQNSQRASSGFAHMDIISPSMQTLVDPPPSGCLHPKSLIISLSCLTDARERFLFASVPSSDPGTLLTLQHANREKHVFASRFTEWRLSGLIRLCYFIVCWSLRGHNLLLSDEDSWRFFLQKTVQ